MQSKVKELFNNIYLQEEKASLISKSTRDRRRRRVVGIKPDTNISISPLSDFTHFIECDVDRSICPMQWEDLSIDLTSTQKRYCEFCEKYVYRVDNEFMLEKLFGENRCIAISDMLLERINGKVDEEQQKNLNDRLSVSKLFLVFKREYRSVFESYTAAKLSDEEILKMIILDIVNAYGMESTIQWYMKKGVDLEFIFTEVLPHIQDGEFQEKVLQRFE